MRQSVLMFVFSSGLFGCADPRATDGEMDVIAARAVSDSVMAGLIRNRLDLILERMDSALLAAAGRTSAEAAIGKLIDYCGRPLGADFERYEAKYTLNASGGHRALRFKYAPRTTKHPKGVCIWSVDVIRTDDGLRVEYVRAGYRVN